jgi:hypothetical protein
LCARAVFMTRFPPTMVSTARVPSDEGLTARVEK